MAETPSFKQSLAALNEFATGDFDFGTPDNNRVRDSSDVSGIYQSFSFIEHILASFYSGVTQEFNNNDVL